MLGFGNPRCTSLQLACAARGHYSNPVPFVAKIHQLGPGLLVAKFDNFDRSPSSPPPDICAFKQEDGSHLIDFILDKVGISFLADGAEITLIGGAWLGPALHATDAGLTFDHSQIPVFFTRRVHSRVKKLESAVH